MSVSSLVFCYFSFLSLTAAQWNTLQCGRVSHSKRTVFENPTRLPESCQYTIEAYSPHVCQLLIQFERFSLEQPILRNGVLECTDRFTVGEFTLCGDNDQQHLYIPLVGAAFSNQKPKVSFDFLLPNRWSQTRWRIAVTQLECTYRSDVFRLSNLPGFGFLQTIENATRTFFPPPSFGDLDVLAPMGCHQYFTQPKGIIRSFNFNAAQGTLYMANMNYVICVKAPVGVQKIEYSIEKFSMSKQDPDLIGFDVNCHSSVQTAGRRSDFLMIPQATMVNLPFYNIIYYCGQSLENHQLIGSLPFHIYFQSDDMTDPTETGFSIIYSVK